MAAPALSGSGGLRIAVGASSTLPAGWLPAGPQGVADPWFSPGRPLPFEDRTVEAVTFDVGTAIVDRPRLLGLLLECRRALQGDGVLAFVAQATSATALDADLIASLALMAGLSRASGADASIVQALGVDGSKPPGCWTKRERRVSGDPRVTIAIPAYNPRFFAAALDSAVWQTYPAVDIVVCDDSPDDAIERIARARADARPLRYVRNPARLGVRANYRRCLEVADGEFVKFLCDDDVLAPTCVAALVDAFRRVPDLALATSHRRRIDERGAALPDQAATVAPVRRDTTLAGWSLANALVVSGLNFIGEPSTTLFRRRDLLDHAPDYFVFDGAHGHGIIDIVTWASLLLKGDAVYLRTSLSDFRIHPGQRQNDPAKRERNVQSVLELQQAWRTLGLDRWLTPDLLRVKPFPPAARDPWRLVQMRSAAGRVPANH